MATELTDVEWSRTPFPSDRCVHELIAEQAERTPDAIVEDLHGARLTYAELEARASQLARHLQSLGVAPGTLVAVAVERSLEMLVAVLGVMKAGGAYVPLDPSYPTERLGLMLDDSQAQVVITQEALLRELPDHQGITVCVDRDREEIEAHEPVAPDSTAGPRDLAYVIYTSGSTGRPKGVMVEHRGVCNLLHDMSTRPGLTSSDTLLAVTTLSFDIAGVELYLPLIVGAHLIVASRRVAADGRLLLDALERSGATAMQATPATWRLLVEAGWGGTPGLKTLCGGEALPVALARQLIDRSSEVWNLYGPTEATIWSMFQRVERPEDALSIGRPFANTSIYVLDESFEPVGSGAAGELWIGGVGLARGYLNRPDLTAERFVPDPFAGGRMYRTGDLARFMQDGRVEFLGRIDNQVKVRGFRIELGEIETVLEESEDIRAAVAVARERQGEKRLLAYVVTQPGRSPGSAELRRRLAERLPEYMVPSAIVRVDEFPLTPNGKVDRNALPEPGPEFELEGEVVPPSNDVERRLVQIWERVLGISPIGIRHDFFDLGADSLTAARLFAEVEKEFGRKLPLTPVFEAPTIERLAELVSGKRASSSASSLVPIQPRGDRPPLFCVHGGAGTILFYHELARRLGSEQPFYGLQARGIYGRDAPLRTVDEMAAHYVSELRQVQPEGPYHLVGYCFGGIVAYEMAQRLRASGEEVALLGLINAPSPLYIHAHNPWFRPQDDDAPPPPPRSRLRSWVGLRVWPLRRRLHHARFHAYMALGRPLPDKFRNGYFLLIAHIAEREYQPRPYSGTLLSLHGEGLYVEPDLGWGELVGDGLASVEVPGPHVIPRDSMAEPLVGFVAEELQRALERATVASRDNGVSGAATTSASNAT